MKLCCIQSTKMCCGSADAAHESARASQEITIMTVLSDLVFFVMREEPIILTLAGQ